MNWIYDNAELLTIVALTAMPIALIVSLILLAAAKTPETSDLEDYPLGDYPPLELIKGDQNDPTKPV